MPDWRIIQGDVIDGLRSLPDGCAQTCVTSPPYWGLRDYGVAGQIGLEPTPAEYLAKMVEVFREVRRVLRDDGTAWVNMGDGYAHGGGSGAQGSTSQRQGRSNVEAQEDRSERRVPDGLKPKDLIGMPWRLAFALQADGWYLRSDIIWSKPNPMPESVTDRPTKAHEYIFLLAKSARYYFDAEAVKEAAEYAGENGARPQTTRVTDGISCPDFLTNPSRYYPSSRNIRTVWTVATQAYPEAHFATYPEKLIEPCILAGCPKGGLVLDPFTGSGTTAVVALRHGRRFVGCELSAEYVRLAEKRIGQSTNPATHRTDEIGDAPLFAPPPELS